MTLLLGNNTLNKFIEGVSISNKNTAFHYRRRLETFRVFVLETHKMSLDEMILTLTTVSHGPKVDIYDLLSEYVSYIHKKKTVSPLTLKLLLSTVKCYLETFDVEISPKKYKLKVRLPKVKRAEKEALSRQNVQTILNACDNIRLKTYVLFLASSGCRAVEALSIRLCDVNWENDPVTIFIRGEFTKTQKDHTVMLTKEMEQQLKSWIEYKHRTRRINNYNSINKKSNVRKLTPKINEEALIFASWHTQSSDPTDIYSNILIMFDQVLKRLGGKFAAYENSYKRRKRITFHSLRRFVRSTVANLGYSDFAEQYILNHSGTPYYKLSPDDRINIFKKIEPSLTYLDQTSLERRGIDLTNRLDTVERENIELRNNINKIMEMIRENPKLAQVKPEALVNKKGKKG